MVSMGTVSKLGCLLISAGMDTPVGVGCLSRNKRRIPNDRGYGEEHPKTPPTACISFLVVASLTSVTEFQFTGS